MEAINLEIADLMQAGDFPSGSVPGTRIAALVLCREILSSGRVDLRDLVRVAVKGKQNQSARAAGVRTATLSAYLNRKTAMSADTVQRILNASLEITDRSVCLETKGS